MDLNKLLNSDDFLVKNEEFERQLVAAEPEVTHKAFLMTPVYMLRNNEFREWDCTSRSGTFWYLYSYIIRNKMNNRISKYLYNKYYIKHRKIVASFTQDRLALGMGYKDRRGVNNHLTQLIDEGVIKVHTERWGRISIKIYEFGVWKEVNDRIIEILHVHEKFKVIMARNKKKNAVGKLSEFVTKN